MLILEWSTFCEFVRLVAVDVERQYLRTSSFSCDFVDNLLYSSLDQADHEHELYFWFLVGAASKFVSIIFLQ